MPPNKMPSKKTVTSALAELSATLEKGRAVRRTAEDQRESILAYLRETGGAKTTAEIAQALRLPFCAVMSKLAGDPKNGWAFIQREPGRWWAVEVSA